MRAEPKTILLFLYNHYDVVKRLFLQYGQYGNIQQHELDELLEDTEPEIRARLLEYKLLKPIGSDFEMHSVFFSLMEFILSEFKPLLPETIGKYHHSISKLYQKIRAGINGDRVLVAQMIRDLNGEIREFLELVERNTSALLKETRELKANVSKIEYREKVLRASRWIEEYVLPLNKILDVSHGDSVAQQLYDVAQYANNRRLNFDDENIRLQFEKLYDQLINTNDELLRQSKILINELLPLIERIRTESMILTGWIEFLKKPYRRPVPKLLKATRASLISKSMYINTWEYFEQFSEADDVFLEDESVEMEKWIFNKAAYKELLMSQLPVENFFDWAGKLVQEEYKDIDPEKLFALMMLLFEEEVVIEPMGDAETFDEIRTTRSLIKVPQIKVTTDGLF